MQLSKVEQTTNIGTGFGFCVELGFLCLTFVFFCFMCTFSDNTVKKSDVKKRKAQQQDLAQTHPTVLQAPPPDSVTPPNKSEIPNVDSNVGVVSKQATPTVELVPTPPPPPSDQTDSANQSEAGDTPRER